MRMQEVIFIKKDKNWSLCYIPKHATKISLDKGEYWINPKGERVYHSLPLMEFLYNKDGERLKEPVKVDWTWVKEDIEND